MRNPMTQIGKKRVPEQGPADLTQGLPVIAIAMLVGKPLAADSRAPLHIQKADPSDVG